MKQIMEELEEAVASELENGLRCVDADEMGKVIDMIKDCSMSLYYYTVYKQMNKDEQWRKYGQQTMFQNEDADIAMMYGKQKKNDYSEAKAKYTNPDDNSKRMRMNALNDYLDDMEHEIKEALIGMWADEKVAMKSRINKLINM
jgi:hypothetical protein